MPTWNLFRPKGLEHCPVPAPTPRGKFDKHGKDLRKRQLPSGQSVSAPRPSAVDSINSFTVVYTRHHATSGLSSYRSVRSNRSRSITRSSQLSTRSRGSKLQALRDLHEIHHCYVCSNEFSGMLCETCDTSHDTFGTPESDCTAGIDLELLCELSNSNDFPLLQAVVSSAFSDISTVIASFYIRNPTPPDSDPSTLPPFDIDVENINTFYDVLSNVSSNSAMRAVLHGASMAMRCRPYGPPTDTELRYILALLQCPIFTDCSMFTKLTGPLQKLGRYASYRMPARVVLEKCLGLLANSSPEQRDRIVSYFATVDKEYFAGLVELLNGYVAHRLGFIYHQKTNVLDPSRKNLIPVDMYCLDWRLTATTKVLSILFSANNISRNLAVSSFYNSMVDNVELNHDFDRWFMNVKPLVMQREEPVFSTWQTQPCASMPFGERRFYFCRFPFMLSIAAKNRIFDHTVRREMDAMVRKEMFSRLAGHQTNFRLPRSGDSEVHIRRNHLLEDSVAKLEPLDLALRLNIRVRFVGEPAIDAGGPRKEWLALLFKELLDPKRAIFVTDETSSFSWLGTADLSYYTIAGIAFGLALRNSTSLDVNFPQILFKRMLGQTCNLADVEQLWPLIAQSARAILDYDKPDFEEVFGLNFVSPSGAALVQGGDQVPVTLENKEEYITLLVTSLVDTPQMQAICKGFSKTVGGASLSLYRAEEIDYLVHGDRRPIDVQALQSVTKYKNFGCRSKIEAKEPVVLWFWEFFASLDPEKQARLLAFVTASDRIPPMGVHNMTFRISCLGNDSENLPTAHTCFNQLGIYRYSSREKFERKMLFAMNECRGFGIK
ncbi:putative E3 ubiquitin-protein ligase mug30 [Wickerhamiella sorbophila]|uniref:HECT-type E3 ubiquitin transferase n=1 Tax=Wickerhamiella sorbophila TaxID=45607 RepID=A0A2T0FG78_9ASCO|nr:putative E3 ubiquitin-protein ligase mug30 [Wickerhamiella sorbophila]PRT53996.1 putative E3 ubiquitin-protein ligase mug30 [Wickerhamiella sorbophila]